MFGIAPFYVLKDLEQKVKILEVCKDLLDQNKNYIFDDLEWYETEEELTKYQRRGKKKDQRHPRKKGKLSMNWVDSFGIGSIGSIPSGGFPSKSLKVCNDIRCYTIVFYIETKTQF